MSAAAEALYLPLTFLTVALLGGVRIAGELRFVPPPLFALVLAVLLVGALVRGSVLVPTRLLSASRTSLENMNGLVIVLSLFFGGAQIFNLITPESGLPYVLFNVLLFALLITTLAGAADRISMLRSLAVVIGSAFILKFIVLAALSDPGESMLKRVFYVLFEGITLGTMTQQRVHPMTGYLAFGAVVLFLIGLAMLPARPRTSALVKSIE